MVDQENGGDSLHLIVNLHIKNLGDGFYVKL